MAAGRTLESGVAVNITASGDVIAKTDCVLIGFYVNSTSSGTIALKKGGSGGTALGGTITPAIGFHRYPASCPGGLYATIGSTIDVTFFVDVGAA